MVWLTPTMVSEAKIMVTATQKMLSVAFAMFFATEQIASAQTQWSIQHRLRPFRFGSPFRNRASPIPSWFFLELQPARFIITSGNSPSDPTDQPQLHRKCALKFLSGFFYFSGFFLIGSKLDLNPQWVLSLPFALRYRLAYDSSLVRDALQIFVRSIFASIRRRAGIAASNRQARCGAVAFIQRFSDALNLDPHFHVLALDGIYVVDGEGEPVFRRLPRRVMPKLPAWRSGFIAVLQDSWRNGAWARKRIRTRRMPSAGRTVACRTLQCLGLGARGHGAARRDAHRESG